MPIFGTIDRSRMIASAILVMGPSTKISTGFEEYFNVNIINSTASKGDGCRKISTLWLRQDGDVKYVSIEFKIFGSMFHPDDIIGTLKIFENKMMLIVDV